MKNKCVVLLLVLCMLVTTVIFVTPTVHAEQEDKKDAEKQDEVATDAEDEDDPEYTIDRSDADPQKGFFDEDEKDDDEDEIVRADKSEDKPLELTEEEKKAMEKEPAYGKTVRYWLADGCTAGPRVADLLGYYEDLGLKAEGVKGTSYTEALGTGAAEVAVGHIATMLVPSTNGVDLTFVGGAHIGCKSLYVLADSEYKSTEDLKGTKISTPNGIGASDYNITCMLLDADGIDPLKDVTLTPVETSACVAAMERGEISAALFTDSFAHDMMMEGKLRCVRSLTWDKDFQELPCCIIAMNKTYIEENPIHARLIASAVKRAHNWMRRHPEEATQMLIDEGLNSEDEEKSLEFNKSLHFGLTDDFTARGLRHIAEKYMQLGIITAMDDIEDVMDKAWTPLE